jgi:hypothetical protein
VASSAQNNEIDYGLNSEIGACTYVVVSLQLHSTFGVVCWIMDQVSSSSSSKCYVLVLTYSNNGGRSTHVMLQYSFNSHNGSSSLSRSLFVQYGSWLARGSCEMHWKDTSFHDDIDDFNSLSYSEARQPRIRNNDRHSKYRRRIIHRIVVRCIVFFCIQRAQHLKFVDSLSNSQS